MIAGVTDYEAYVADPAEPRRPPPLARWRTPLASLSVLLVALAMVFLWLDARGSQDPALTAPDGAATPAQPTPAPPGAQPAAPPADAAPTTAP